MENNDVFTLDSLPPEPEPKIQVLVNGEVTGETDRTRTLSEVAREFAATAGLKAFAVYLDGERAKQDQAGDTLEDYERIELVAKDARG